MSAPETRFDRVSAPTPPQDGDAWYAPVSGDYKTVLLDDAEGVREGF